MNMSTAINIFAKAVVRERRIPFEINAALDSFSNEYNQAFLKESINKGKGQAVITKTMAELESMEND